MHEETLNRISLVDLLLLGGKVEWLGGKIERSIMLDSAHDARQLYKRMAAQLETLAGSSGIRLECDNTTVSVTVPVAPPIYRFFEQHS